MLNTTEQRVTVWQRKCEYNAFENDSAEGEIALYLPLTSSSLSSVSLWKDTEINSAVIFVLHPPRLPLISRAPCVRHGRV